MRSQRVIRLGRRANGLRSVRWFLRRRLIRERHRQLAWVTSEHVGGFDSGSAGLGFASGDLTGMAHGPRSGGRPQGLQLVFRCRNQSQLPREVGAKGPYQRSPEVSSGSDDEPQARSPQRYLHQPRQAIPADPSPITAPTISGYLLVGSGFHWASGGRAGLRQNERRISSGEILERARHRVFNGRERRRSARTEFSWRLRTSARRTVS